MSEQSESLTTPQSSFDAISCTGLLMLLMFVLVGLSSLFEPLTSATPLPPTAIANNEASSAPDLVPPTPVQDLVPQDVTDAGTVALTQITATPIRPTATRTAAPSATPPPTHTLTPIPTTTPSPTPTEQPLQSAPAEDLVQPTATPEPTPAPILPTPTPGANATSIAIFMYHYVSEPPADANIYRQDLSVRPDELRTQLQHLAVNGYTTVDFYDLARALAGIEPLPPNAVILTFDDGYRDNYENAFPLLKEFGMTATFFVMTNPVEEWNNDYMTWPMLEEMAAAGMRIEPHTKSHPNLVGRNWDFVVDEIQTSRDLIANHIGYTPRFFAYPSGRYEQQTIDVLYALDFWGAVTTEFGSRQTYDDRYELKRKRVPIYNIAI